MTIRLLIYWVVIRYRRRANDRRRERALKSIDARYEELCRAVTIEPETIRR